MTSTFVAPIDAGGTGGWGHWWVCARKGLPHALSGFDDIVLGGSVLIADDAGATLSPTKLGPGTCDKDGYCDFSFTASVPAGKHFYGVSVGHRNSVKYTEADVATVALRL
jgi:hypothetical protein